MVKLDFFFLTFEVAKLDFFFLTCQLVISLRRPGVKNVLIFKEYAIWRRGCHALCVLAFLSVFVHTCDENGRKQRHTVMKAEENKHIKVTHKKYIM